MGETPEQIRRAVEGWTAADFERTYAPGKWSIRVVLIHLAQTELALTTRVRFARESAELRSPGVRAGRLDRH